MEGQHPSFAGATRGVVHFLYPQVAVSLPAALVDESDLDGDACPSFVVYIPCRGAVWGPVWVLGVTFPRVECPVSPSYKRTLCCNLSCGFPRYLLHHFVETVEVDDRWRL